MNSDQEKIISSGSYTKAYRDLDFMMRDELRPVRLQLELLKPELIQQEHGIESTIVVFGSARLVSPEKAEQMVQSCRAAVEKDRSDSAAAAAMAHAERLLRNSRYYQQAREFARIVSTTCQVDNRKEYVVVTGGGPGIMEAANRGAHDAEAKSIGLNITLPYEQLPNRFITPELCFNFHYFAIRKMHFLMRARALVAFPGGFGTFDELFETLTLIQTEKVERVPVVLFGREFWERIISFDTMVEEGVISPEDPQLFSYAESAEEAWEIISNFHHNEE